MEVDSFTISYSFDPGTYGRKSSNFVSVNFKLPTPMGVSDLDRIRLEASKKVTMWAIQDALMRGEISPEDAKERLEIVKMNFEGMVSALNQRESK